MVATTAGGSAGRSLGPTAPTKLGMATRLALANEMRTEVTPCHFQADTFNCQCPTLQPVLQDILVGARGRRWPPKLAQTHS